MIKKLVIMRHGQTLFNQRKRVQGWVDSPLTELGIEQAKAEKPFINSLNLKFDHAYSSTSERACDTLELVCDLPYTRLKGLKEWNFGILDGEPEYLNPPIDQYDEFFSSHGGESRAQLVDRMNRTLTEIMEKEDHFNVFVASHGGAIRNFERYWTPDDSKFIKGHLGNCAVLVFDYDTNTKTFTLVDIDNPNA